MVLIAGEPAAGPTPEAHMSHFAHYYEITQSRGQELRAAERLRTGSRRATRRRRGLRRSR